jgi:hypothetical protein
VPLCPACHRGRYGVHGRGPRLMPVEMVEALCTMTRPEQGFTAIRAPGADLSRSCGWCGVGLAGMRADALYCSTSHRVLA